MKDSLYEASVGPISPFEREAGVENRQCLAVKLTTDSKQPRHAFATPILGVSDVSGHVYGSRISVAVRIVIEESVEVDLFAYLEWQDREDGAWTW